MPTSKRRKKRLLAEKQRREKAKRLHTLAIPVEDDAEVSCEMARNETSWIEQDDDRLQANGSAVPGWAEALVAPLGLSQLYSSCVEHIESAKDYIFPSRCIKRELVATRQRLQEVESELDELKQHSKHQSLTETCIPSAVALPLPPPPPTPPPLPPLPGSQSHKLILRSSRGHQQKKKLVEQNQPRITLHDIQNVRLKPTKQIETRQSQTKHRLPVVTVSDLRGVALKQVSRKSKSPGTRKSKGASPEISSLRRSLRRVSISRSPGGTPLVSNTSLDCGEGLTPLMTRALRQKFKNARSPSLSPHLEMCEPCDCNQ